MLYSLQIEDALRLVYRDLEDGKVYRESSVQSSLYHHLRNLLPFKFIYSEFTDGNLIYDLVISEKAVDNENHTNWTKMDNVKVLIEIKFLSYTFAGCTKALEDDIRKLKKLNNKKQYKNIEKYVIFIFEMEERHKRIDDLRKKNKIQLLSDVEIIRLKNLEGNNLEIEKKLDDKLMKIINWEKNIQLLGFAWYWEKLSLRKNR